MQRQTRLDSRHDHDRNAIISGDFPRAELPSTRGGLAPLLRTLIPMTFKIRKDICMLCSATCKETKEQEPAARRAPTARSHSLPCCYSDPIRSLSSAFPGPFFWREEGSFRMLATNNINRRHGSRFLIVGKRATHNREVKPCSSRISHHH